MLASAGEEEGRAIQRGPLTYRMGRRGSSRYSMMTLVVLELLVPSTLTK